MMKEQQVQSLDDAELIGLLQTVLDAGGVFPLVVTGNSMVPTVRSGRDKVFLASPERRKPQVGELVFAWCDKEKYVLHRIIRRLDAERFLLCGDANMETEIIRKKDIVAVAESFCRKGRTVGCDSPAYRCYVWLWMHVRWLRPWIFRVHGIRNRWMR